jgi:multicomponent Na+:H+ antiporter subunit B
VDHRLRLYVTPGGGFQGGVVASAGALLLWLAGSYRTLRDLSPTFLIDAAEGLGAASYIGVGLLGLAAGSAFLYNAIPLGTAGTLASGGTIAALNWVAGIEVAAAFVLIYHEFLEEYIQTFTYTKAEQ